MLAGYKSRLIHETSKSLIYLSEQENAHGRVIIKILKDANPSPDQIFHFYNEYEFTNELAIPGIRKAIKKTKVEDKHALILEYIEGTGISKYYFQQERTQTEFLNIAVSLSNTLLQVHKKGIIHKDLNPNNILYDTIHEIPVIIDFSIATRVNSAIDNSNGVAQLEGTLAYISPEQTGRLNRVIDQRSDLYSLGITFYQLLTGQVPFEAEDPLEMVHLHVAQKPIPPKVVKRSVDPQLSDIVLKLLAKNPEDRYQTTEGLLADLKKCQHFVQDNRSIPVFTVGENDYPDRFSITQEVVGREKESELISKIFSRVCAGSSEILLIEGETGVGKSAFVLETQKSLTEKNALFIKGTYNEFNKNIPYSALLEALKEFVSHLLTENEYKLEFWKNEISKTLGSLGRVLTDVIPNLELLLGPQPSIQELPGQEAQNRFTYVMSAFFRTISRKNQPLIIFLDDIHLADSATFEFLKRILSEPAQEYLLIIGTYRSEQNYQSEYIKSLVTEASQKELALTTIALSNLSENSIALLLQKTLHNTPAQCEELATIIKKKTSGNPFFITQFLKSLYDNGILKLIKTEVEPQRFKTEWIWKKEEVIGQEITNNVVGLVRSKIDSLSAQLKDILEQAACIGESFEFATLVSLTSINEKEIVNLLTQAIEAGIITSYNENYKLAAEEAIDYTGIPILFRFSHNKVHEAVYLGIEEYKKISIHYALGQLKLQSNEQTISKNLFDVVAHLNKASSLIEEQTEKNQLAQLNFLAAKHAKESAAPVPAFNYISESISMLSPTVWKDDYNLAITVYTEAAELCYMAGKKDQMAVFMNMVLSQARSFLDKAKIYELQIAAFMAEGDAVKAMDCSRKALKEVNIIIPEKASKFEILWYVLKIEYELLGKKPEDIISIPKATDPQILAINKILIITGLSSYWVNPDFVAILLLKILWLSLKHGLCPETTEGLNIFSAIQSIGFNNLKKALKYTEVAFHISELFDEKINKSRFYIAKSGIIDRMAMPLRDCISPLLTSYKLSLEAGSNEYASISLLVSETNAIQCGLPLQSLRKTAINNQREIARLGNKIVINSYIIWYYFILRLSDKTDTPFCLNENEVLEEELLKSIIEVKDNTATFQFYYLKAYLHYLLGSDNKDLELINQAGNYLEAVTPSHTEMDFHLYDSLIHLKYCTNYRSKDFQNFKKKILLHKKKLKSAAAIAPQNYLHKLYILEAELYRVKGKKGAAAKHYQKAIQTAIQTKYLHEEALAWELAGKFHLSHNEYGLAELYIKKARTIYAIWGATIKVDYLENKYPLYLKTSKEDSILNPTLFAATNTDISTNTHSLDIKSIIKASTSLVVEVGLDKLLTKLMSIAIENAGADKGVLILEEDGYWVIQAETAMGTGRVQVLQSVPLNKTDNEEASVPKRIINYVIRTKDTVLLDNACEEERFGLDSYIKKHKPKSVLCLPLVNQGSLIGILYLENNLVTGAFTKERTEVLNLLSSQMAVSIQKSIIYEHLEEKVRERTGEVIKQKREIELQNKILEDKNHELQKLSDEKSNLMGIVAHDLRTPLNQIKGIAMLFRMTSENLTEDQKEAAEMIFASSTRLSKMISDILDISAVESRKIKLKLTEVDVEDLLEELASDFNSLAAKKYINIYLNKYPNKHYINADKGYLRQILDNLISNAIKFSPMHKNIYLYYELIGNEVRIVVKDEGPGLSKEDMKKLFGKFQKLSARPTAGEDSTGLGLSIVKRYVEEMGGKVWSESIFGEGASFIISFPVCH